MFRALLIIMFIIAAAGCSSKSPPPPTKNYQLEALQNDVSQINRFIDNWSGFDQEYSSISNLKEYNTVKRKILASPEYHLLSGRAQFENKTNQFDAIVKRYEIWVDERGKLLDEMNHYYQQYKDGQHQFFSAQAKPLTIGSYEIAVANAYYAMAPIDPDQAYASARYIGLKQLDIIAASRDQPLRLPTFNITDFVVDIRIINRSNDKILRPNGFVRHHRSIENIAGTSGSRLYDEYLVRFSDDRKNTYQLNRAYGIINNDSENGIRPGESIIWTYSFNPENHPLETVDKFQARFPKEVFGRGLTLSIPLQVIARPKLPDSFRAGQPQSD